MSTSVTDFASLNAAIDAAEAATAGDFVVTLANDITETATLDAVNLHTGVTLTIDGGGHALDGAGQYRGLFAYAGTLTVSNLSIDNTVARGGDGGFMSGGGGGGLGGGLFVAGTNAGLNSGADVTLNNVTFSGDMAVGGNGSAGDPYQGELGPRPGGGGGGGLGGNGGDDQAVGGTGGGGGIGGNGGTAAAGAPGIVPGAPSGGGSGAANTFPGSTAFPGGANGGGGGGTSVNSFGAGGGGGIGGADAVQNPNGGYIGGAGGVGGGGAAGQNGGAGGGGGGNGGNGGFGGGGGGVVSGTGGQGGYGAGNGATYLPGPGESGLNGANNGGGGLGAGGAVFVQAGGSLTIGGGEISDGSVAGGAGGRGDGFVTTEAGNGQALGSGIFLQGDQTLTFSEAAGQTTTINDVIADQTGSGGTGANAGAGELFIEGPGTLVLAHSNTYSGGTTIASGTLELAAAGAAGTGAISLRAPDATSQVGGTLQLDAAALPDGIFANPIYGFSKGTLIDLAGFADSADTSAIVNGNVLTVSGGGVTNQLTLGDYNTTGPVVLTTFSDGHAGTIVSPAQQLTTDVISLKVSEDAYQGDAQYTVAVDGVTIGGVRTATASHSSGASQDVSVAGTFGPGPHTIGITFLNDAYGGTPDTDRNLYVDALSYDGRTSVPPSAVLYSAGTKSFDISPDSSASKLTLLLAEDAYQGDAQYAISIDGQPGPSGAVTASNAQGQTQAVDLSQTLAPGNHDLAISFLNDAYAGTPDTDRNLYLKGAELNGAPLPGVAATLYSAGTQHITFAVT